MGGEAEETRSRLEDAPTRPQLQAKTPKQDHPKPAQAKRRVARARQIKVPVSDSEDEVDLDGAGAVQEQAWGERRKLPPCVPPSLRATRVRRWVLTSMPPGDMVPSTLQYFKK